MADDNYISDGLTIYAMAKEAGRYRKKFDIALNEKVDVISILELKIPEVISGFHVIVCKDAEIDSFAIFIPSPPRLLVKETVYRGAAEGDLNFRAILAHEIGHILLHGARAGKRFHSSPNIYEEEFSNLNGKESSEAQADLFSIFFLIPWQSAYDLRENDQRMIDLFGAPGHVAKRAARYTKRQEFYTPQANTLP